VDIHVRKSVVLAEADVVCAIPRSVEKYLEVFRTANRIVNKAEVDEGLRCPVIEKLLVFVEDDVCL
jgi:hypothetical protein